MEEVHKQLTVVLKFLFLLVLISLSINIVSATFVVDNSISITGLQYSSQAWTIYNSRPNLDLAICGQTDSTPSNARTLIYTVNSSQATLQSYNITNATVCSISWADIDNNGYDDLILAGNTSTNTPKEILQIYLNNGTGLNLSQSLPGIAYGNAITGDLDNDHDLDVVVIGCENIIPDPSNNVNCTKIKC